MFDWQENHFRRLLEVRQEIDAEIFELIERREAKRRHLLKNFVLESVQDKFELRHQDPAKVAKFLNKKNHFFYGIMKELFLHFRVLKLQKYS